MVYNGYVGGYMEELTENHQGVFTYWEVFSKHSLNFIHKNNVHIYYIRKSFDTDALNPSGY